MSFKAVAEYLSPDWVHVVAARLERVPVLYGKAGRTFMTARRLAMRGSRALRRAWSMAAKLVPRRG
jgi:hypothetical protein